MLKSNWGTICTLETLNENDIVLKARTYPIHTSIFMTGFFTNDPVYGNLILKALELGFTLIAFDSDAKDREKGQAENISRQYNAKEGKLIVYAGLGHIYEKSSTPMTGYDLKTMLNEDVLSISQFTRHSVKPSFPQDVTSELFLKKDTTGTVDYYIYSNPASTSSNIPTWYKWMDFKTILLKDICSESIGDVSLIQLFNLDEVDGVAVYQYLTHKNETVDIAYPKSGNYRLRIMSEKGLIENKVNL